MTIENLLAMITRRGYKVFRVPQPLADPLSPRLYEEIAILHWQTLRSLWWSITASDLDAYRGSWTARVEELLHPLSAGQTHRQCSCGLPVLCSRIIEMKRHVGIGTRPALREEYSTITTPREQQVEYRLASRGAWSDPIVICPQCKARFVESVRDIKDDVTQDERAHTPISSLALPRDEDRQGRPRRDGKKEMSM